VYTFFFIIIISRYTDSVLKYVLKEGSPVQLVTLRDSQSGQLERKTRSKFCYEFWMKFLLKSFRP